MAYYLKYGDTEVRVPLPDEAIAYSVVADSSVKGSDDPVPVINAALDAPYGTDRIENIVKPGETVCIVISDGTRSWQSPGIILMILIDRLAAAGINEKDIRIVSARGTHRAQTDEELKRLVTPEVYDRVGSVRDHDPLDEDGLVMKGTTSRGTPVIINRTVSESDRVILVGSVLHHFLAGFSGGRKSVLPGICSSVTVQANHSLSLKEGGGFEETVRSGNVDGNPVHEDMCEAAALAAPDFIINTVVDDRYRVVEAFAGDIFKAHEAACRLVDRMNRVSVPKKCPVVIASAGGYPKDMNVYQPLKTLCHMLECVEPGGTIIMLSESREGFGSDDTEMQIKGFDTMEAREKALRAHYTIGAATGYLYADAAEKYDFIYVTKLPASEFASTKMRICSSLEEALSLIPKPDKESVCLMPDGSVTLPDIRPY